jgi:hypothetical protein
LKVLLGVSRFTRLATLVWPHSVANSWEISHFVGKIKKRGKGEKYDNVVTCGENKHRQQESTYLITDTQMSF